jgi:hypothetical protein
MVGRYYDPNLKPKFYSVRFITVVLIPIFPLGIYLVSTDDRGRSYTFHGTISRLDFSAIYKDGYAKLIWNGIVRTFFVSAIASAVIVAMIVWRRRR